MTSSVAHVPSSSGKTPKERTLRTSSLGLVLGKGAQMGSGFLFWMAAARFASTEDVGLTATMVSAVMLCALIGSLGVGAALIRQLPRLEDRVAEALDSGTVVVAAAAATAAAALLLATNVALDELHVVATSPALALVFVLMSVLGAVNVLMDQVSMALRRGDGVLIRNVTGAGVMIGALALVVMLNEDDTVGVPILFACWVLGGLCTTAIGMVQLRVGIGYRFAGRVRRSRCRDLLTNGGPNYVLTFTERGPALVLPLLVTEFLSPTATAHWYPVWMLAWAVFVMPTSVGIALFAEAARGAGEARKALWRSLWWSMQLGGGAAIALAVFAGPVLSLLGPDYAEQGTVPLRILLVGLLPFALAQTYFSMARAAGRMAEAVVVGSVSAAVTVAATIWGGVVGGLDGMAFAWLGVQLAIGGWALVRLLRSQWVRQFMNPQAA